MRPVRYNVAASLDGYLAGPDGDFDWIPRDPSVDFAAIFAKIDTILLGRRSFEVALQGEALPWTADTRLYVFSRTLRAEDHPDVTIVRENAGSTVAELRAEEGDGEMWLFGGGELFRDLLAEGQVDRVEVTVVPILLGEGVPLLPPTSVRTELQLLDTHVYPSGMVTLAYATKPRA